jgi:hypothetical protein
VVDFNYFLNRKYSQLQQQADATTKNAKTNALTGAAAARLDNVRSDLLPDESLAGIRRTDAEVGLIGEQTRIVAPESAARIAQMGAETNRTNVGAKIDERQGLTPLGDLLGAPVLQQLRGLFGGGGTASAGSFRTSDVVPQRARTERDRMLRGLGGNPSTDRLNAMLGSGL